MADDQRYEARVTDLEAGTWRTRPFGSPYEAAGHLGADLTAAGYEAERGWGIRLAEGEAIQHHHRRYEVLETPSAP
ncbi:hypothetical protein OG215_36050 (plasmid) [Streptomyces globisporus]|uniref:hypothetical protein n=1 Tax=Streptomyces globisporus TaxID=1908 RepID=UPI002F90AD32|nr:hypothetical protein OG215_36050 [Streptomyces globisporus]